MFTRAAAGTKDNPWYTYTTTMKDSGLSVSKSKFNTVRFALEAAMSMALARKSDILEKVHVYPAPKD